MQLQNKPLETQAMHAHKSLSVWNFDQNQVQDEEITKCQIELMQDKESDDRGGVDGGSFYTIENEPNVCFWSLSSETHDKTWLDKSAISSVCVHPGFFLFNFVM